MAQLQAARLIPVSGISSDTEAEVRATSALLAVLTAVPDLSAELLTPLGASGAKRAVVEAFIEPAFQLNGSKIRPDGLITVTYGKSSWKCLVEVKTGTNQLSAEQVNAYWDVAREYGFNHVLTISNEFGVAGAHPCEGLRVRSNSPVQISHHSWTYILTTAVRTKSFKGVDDPDQAWILSELIRYLEHPASGALAFDDMGPSWVPVRDQARSATLKKGTDEVHDIASRWDNLIRYAALRLGAETGADVEQVLPRSERDSKSRTASLEEQLCDEGFLDAKIRVPNTAGDVSVALDLRSQQVVASLEIDAPSDKAGRGSIGWLLRQLDDAPSKLMIEAYAPRARTPQSAPLPVVREERDVLLDPQKKDIQRFRLVWRTEAGRGRKSGRKSPGVIDTVLGALDTFYATVVQNITPYQPKAPQTRTDPSTPPQREPERDQASEVLTPSEFTSWWANPAAYGGARSNTP